MVQGPQRATDILGGLCTAWEQAEQEAMRQQEGELAAAVERKELELSQERQRRVEADRRSIQNETRRDEQVSSLLNELLGARERTESWRRRCEEKDRDLAKESQRRQESERQLSWLQQRSQLHENAVRENALLKQQLHDAKVAAARAVTAAADRISVTASPSCLELAKHVAEFECEPLRKVAAASDERLVLKRKLLVKWHPDKQPSAAHVALATQVMQELQNRPEWL